MSTAHTHKHTKRHTHLGFVRLEASSAFPSALHRVTHTDTHTQTQRLRSERHLSKRSKRGFSRKAEMFNAIKRCLLKLCLRESWIWDFMSFAVSLGTAARGQRQPPAGDLKEKSSTYRDRKPRAGRHGVGLRGTAGRRFPLKFESVLLIMKPVY